MYPEIEPFEEFKLDVGDGHTIHIERCGNPDGKPVVFLHGGPGGGITPDYRQYFNPEKYHIVLFDQRGCGRSTPHAELNANTTWHLVADIERIREKLNIDQWMVCGGSWGSTLALCYAIKHPGSVSELVLRGIFMCRPHEIQWFYQQGASRIFPDAWEKYLEPIPEDERGDLLKAYYKRLTSEDKETRIEAAKAWSVWEASTSKLIQSSDLMSDFSQDEFALAFARIESHYFTNNIFTDSNSYILDNTDAIKDIPCEIVHGRYDVVCPVENAWELKAKLPKAKLHIIADAGHSLSEKGIRSKVIEITDQFAN